MVCTFPQDILIKKRSNPLKFHNFHQLQAVVTLHSVGVGWHSTILGLCTHRDTFIPGLQSAQQQFWSSRIGRRSEANLGNSQIPDLHHPSLCQRCMIFMIDRSFGGFSVRRTIDWFRIWESLVHSRFRNSARILNFTRLLAAYIFWARMFQLKFVSVVLDSLNRYFMSVSNRSH